MSQQPPDFDEQEFIKERQQALRDSIAYYAPERKSEREAWVCCALLDNLGIQYVESDLVNEIMDPPDIRFHAAQFEVKEILDEGRKRHLEYRQELEKALEAERAADLLEQFTPRDITYEQIAKLVMQRLPEWSSHYAPRVVAHLDLLIYVNLLHRILDGRSHLPDLSAIASYGWRSVSVVKGFAGWVLHVREDAPSFLVNALGRPRFKPGTE